MSAPIEMRRYLAIMHGKEPVKSAKEPVEETKKDMTMRDMLGKMRKIKDKPLLNLNEDVQNDLTTNIDRKNEEQKIDNYFEEPNVTIKVVHFKVKNNGVILTATVDGQIEFAYTVTPEEETSGIELNYLKGGEDVIDFETGKVVKDPLTGETKKTKGFNPQDPENEDVVKKIKNYYDIFYKYWRDQLFKE